MSSLQKNIWITLGHPRQLAMALVLVKNFSHRFPCHLIISHHKYWKVINLDEYRPLFNSVTIFEPIYHTHRIKDLIRAIIKIFNTKAAIRRLPVQPQDILLSLEVWNYVENLMTTVWRRNKQILLCPGRIATFVSLNRRQIYTQKNRYITKSGYVHFFLDKILGLKKQTYYYWLYDGAKQDHGIAFSRPVNKLYDRVFILKSIFSEHLSGNEIYYPYYSLRTMGGKNAERKMIVFFASHSAATDPAREKKYYHNVSKILQNLKNHYGAQYELHIRLHPNKPDSDKLFDCNGWHINREPGNAQLFVIRHANEIAAAITDKTTGQNFPLNIGIPSYSYHRAMGLEQYLIDFYDNAYRDAPKEFFLESVDAVPQPYEPVTDSAEKINLSLQTIFNEFNAQ